MSQQLVFENDRMTSFRVPDPEGTPLEVARELASTRGGLAAMDDTRGAQLHDVSFEEFIPPRCRKPRKREVRRVIWRGTVADLRAEALAAK